VSAVANPARASSRSLARTSRSRPNAHNTLDCTLYASTNFLRSAGLHPDEKLLKRSLQNPRWLLAPRLSSHNGRQWLSKQVRIDLCSYPNLSVTRTSSLVAAQSGLPLRASLGCQRSSQIPHKHPPISHTQPRHLDKVAKPTMSRYIPYLHELAHGQRSPQENTLSLRVFLSPFSLILVAMG
jgi:hypothetical protein